VKTRFQAFAFTFNLYRYGSASGALSYPMPNAYNMVRALYTLNAVYPWHESRLFSNP
jgi:hypothetical protein